MSKPNDFHTWVKPPQPGALHTRLPYACQCQKCGERLAEGTPVVIMTIRGLETIRGIPRRMRTQASLCEACAEDVTRLPRLYRDFERECECCGRPMLIRRSTGTYSTPRRRYCSLKCERHG